MTMQAGVLRLRLADRPIEHDALAQVEELGRRSVGEIRRVVGLLRPDDADGLVVDVAIEGESVSLPAGLDMSATGSFRRR